MDRVAAILFEEPINGQVLFKSQQDLVNNLMTVPGTEYFVSRDNTDLYVKTQNRLKAYVSQLLSATVVRIITPDFEKALTEAVFQKLGDESRTKTVVDQIIRGLRSKRTQSPKDVSRQSLVDQLSNDFRSAQYISVITSRPLEIEAEITEQMSLRKLVFNDFIDSVISDRPLKDYRFNFPSDSTAKNFWAGLNKLLIKYLKTGTDRSRFLTSIRKKLSVDFETQSDLFLDQTLPDSTLNEVSQAILAELQKECKVVVFHTDAPVYTLPLIVIDPAAMSTAKIYAVLDLDDNAFNVHRFSKEEVIYWRQSVWDVMKSHFPGKQIDFKRDNYPN